MVAFGLIHLDETSAEWNTVVDWGPGLQKPVSPNMDQPFRRRCPSVMTVIGWDPSEKKEVIPTGLGAHLGTLISEFGMDMAGHGMLFGLFV